MAAVRSGSLRDFFSWFPVVRPDQINGRKNKTAALPVERDRLANDSIMSFVDCGGKLALFSVGDKNGHADNANTGIFGLVSGNPGIDRIQGQAGSEDLSGTFIHDGIHSSILSI
jgi:hypothetical protein